MTSSSSSCCPAPCHEGNAFTWLLCPDIDHVFTALQVLNELAQENKAVLVEKVLVQCNPEACVDALQKLLKTSASWLGSIAVNIFGVLLEDESMVQKLQKWTEGDDNLVCALAQILAKDEPDIVMNAAETVASLVETASGRQWLLQSQTVFNQVLERLSILLEHERENTVNSAALILARLSLCEEACQRVLSHPSASRTFRCLIQCLSCSHKDTAMNAAFAVGRLCGSTQAKGFILREAKEHQLVSSLQALLSAEAGLEMGQTACFALSCLASDEDGHALLMENTFIHALLDGLLQLLQSADPDSIWFAAMTVRVLVSRPRGVIVVRMNCPLQEQLKMLSISSSTGPELQEEVSMCLRRLERLPKPPPVTVTKLLSTAFTVSWERCEPESGLQITYSLFDRDVMLYRGLQCQVKLPVSNAQTVEPLSLRLNLSTPDGDVSPFSEPVVITMEQLGAGLKPPRELCVIGYTATQVRLRWLEPDGDVKPKSYQIYCNETLVKTTIFLGAIVTGLSPSTDYQLSVSSLGPGDTESPRAVTEMRTADDQDHGPSGLTIAVLGRHEVQIHWGAPVAPLGRLFKYELSLNGCVAYRGTERTYTARRLSANTAYTCIVTAITSRGRFQSKPVTKKTARDEYLHSNRSLNSVTHQPPSELSTPSPLSQKMSEVTKNTINSPTTLGNKAKVLCTMGQHKTLALRKDRHRQPSAQAHSEYMRRVQTQSSNSEDLTHLRGKISPARLPQWSSGRNIPIDRDKLPCISKQISEDVRLVQPVSFSWCNLESTGHHHNRAQRARIQTDLRLQSQQRGRQHCVP